MADSDFNMNKATVILELDIDGKKTNHAVVYRLDKTSKKEILKTVPEYLTKWMFSYGKKI